MKSSYKFDEKPRTTVTKCPPCNVLTTTAVLPLIYRLLPTKTPENRQLPETHVTNVRLPSRFRINPLKPMPLDLELRGTRGLDLNETFTIRQS